MCKEYTDREREKKNETKEEEGNFLSMLLKHVDAFFFVCIEDSFQTRRRQISEVISAIVDIVTDRMAKINDSIDSRRKENISCDRTRNS